MRIHELFRLHRLFRRRISSRRMIVLLASLFLLSLSATVALVSVTLINAKAQSTNWNTFHDPVYGFSFNYPNTWILTSESNGSRITLLDPVTQTTMSPIVTEQKGTVAAILKRVVPSNAVGVQTRTIAGQQAVDFTLPYVAAPKVHLMDASAPLPQQTRQVVVPVTNASGATDVYTFQLIQPTDATGKISTAEQAENAIFETMLKSFGLPVTSHAAFANANTIGTSACDRVCWADANWNYNYNDDSAGPYSFYCDANAYNYGYSANSGVCVDPNIYAAQVPASGVYYQPNFQCADFLSRALTQDGLIPGLTDGGVNGSPNPSSWSAYQSYKAQNGKTYNLIWTANQGGSDTTLGLREYLLDNGLGADIGTNTSQLQRGDVIFLPGASGFRGHAMIATSNPFQVNGTWEIEADGHNRADYHMVLTPGGYGWDLIHLKGTAYHHMGGFSQFGTDMYQLHSDGSIWKYTGPPFTGWQQLDNNPKATAIATDGKGNLYQLHSDGTIWKYTGPPFTGWQQLDNNLKTIAIATDGVGNLYQLHSDGTIWERGGPGWLQLDNNPLTTAIATDGVGNLYQLHSDGSIWKRGGPGWLQLDNNPLTTAIAADGVGNLYQLRSDGSIWKYATSGWLQLDNNSLTTAIAADNVGNLYQLRNDGSIWKYATSGWLQLDNNSLTTAIAANGNGNLYQLHSDGAIWEYTGPPGGPPFTGWQQLDKNPRAVALSGAY